MSTANISEPPVALTIAGVDPSGGAGVLADVRTFVNFGCFPTAVITSLTFQNTTGVSGALHQTADTVRGQALPLVRDFKISGAKTGMLPTSEVIAEVARLFRNESLPKPVVDPVMQATSGDSLIDDAAVSTLVTQLFPLARLVTPNIPEAERLTGLEIRDQEGMTAAAKAIRALGAAAVLIKGGHLAQSSPEAIDVFVDGDEVIVFREPMLPVSQIHGSGCTLSAAIAAGLATGSDLREAVAKAKTYITSLIRCAPRLGHGATPLFNSQW
jgi:hydroxymethylpyrimidine kinase/phosphomethylpyrimidine kinase